MIFDDSVSRPWPRNGIWGPSTSFVSWGCSFHREICRCSARACDDVCLIGDEQTVARTCRECMWRTSASLDLWDFFPSDHLGVSLKRSLDVETLRELKRLCRSEPQQRVFEALGGDGQKTQYPCSFNHGVLDCLLCSGSTWWTWWTISCCGHFSCPSSLSCLYFLFQAFSLNQIALQNSWSLWGSDGDE